jgi:hypothetical protein
VGQNYFKQSLTRLLFIADKASGGFEWDFLMGVLEDCMGILWESMGK